MTRKDLRAMGIEDEDMITKILNARKVEINDANDAHATEIARLTQIEPVAQKPIATQPAVNQPVPAAASAPDETERLRQELAAEKAKNAERERRDAIVAALSTQKAKSVDVLYKLLDPSKITIENGVIKAGLDEQVKDIKTTQGYLFSDTADPTGGSEPKGGSLGTQTMNDYIRGKGV